LGAGVEPSTVVEGHRALGDAVDGRGTLGGGGFAVIRRRGGLATVSPVSSATGDPSASCGPDTDVPESLQAAASATKGRRHHQEQDTVDSGGGYSGWGTHLLAIDPALSNSPLPGERTKEPYPGEGRRQDHPCHRWGKVRKGGHEPRVAGCADNSVTHVPGLSVIHLPGCAKGARPQPWYDDRLR